MRRVTYLLSVFTFLALMLVFVVPYGFAIETPVEDALLKGNWQGVIEILEKDNTKAEDPVARLIMGNAFLATNKNNESMLLFLSAKEEDDLKLWTKWTDSLLDRHPQNPIALYLSADAKARHGRLKEAIEGFTQAIKIKENLALAYNARGVVRVLTNEWDDALGDLLQATQHDAQLADAHANLGTYWILKEAPEGALESSNNALEINPDFALAHLAKGIALYGKGNFEDSLEEIEMAKATLPFISDLADYNREMLNVSFNRFLHDVNLITDGERPGTTLEMKSFKQGEVDLGDGKKMNVYIMRPRDDYNSVRSTITDIAGDLSKRIGKPIDQLRIHVEAHGWASSANDLKAHGALLAGASGKDGVIILDLPEFRGGYPPETKGVDKIFGMGKAAVKWKDVSDIAGKKVAMTGAAINTVTKNPASYYGHSGASEAFVKQGEIFSSLPREVREGMRWKDAVLTGYPFSQTLKLFKDVKVSTNLTQRVDGSIFNLHTTQEEFRKFTDWSNPLSGEKVVNLNLTANNRPISHTRWNDIQVNGVMNPSLIVGTEILRGESPSDSIKTIAKTYDTVGSFQAFWNTNQGLTISKIISSSASASGLEDFKDPGSVRSMQRDFQLSRRNPASVPVIILDNTSPGSLNRIILNLDKVTPSFPGSSKRILLQGSGPEVMEVENYLARHKIGVGVSYLSRDLPQLQIVANKTIGHYTGPFDAIVLLDDKPLRGAPPSTELALVSPEGTKINTTVKHFLQGDIPTTKLDQALANEFAMTQQFRQGFGKPMTWHDWFHTGPKTQAEITKPSEDTFKPTPVTSFGQDKIADVWHWDASQINSSTAAQKITHFARSMGESEVIIRTNDPLKAEGLTEGLKKAGLNPHIIQGNPEGMVKVETTVAGMSLNTKNPIVVGLYNQDKRPEAIFSAGTSFKTELPGQGYLVRHGDDMGNILPLVQKIAKQPGSGKVFIMGGDDLYTSALKMQFADRGLEAIKAPPLLGAISNIHQEKFDTLIGVKGAPFPSTLKRDDEYRKYTVPPPCLNCFEHNWNVSIDHLEQNGVIKHYLPPQPVRPGGVSMKEFAKTWVDRGDWPLVVGFGLGYR